MTSRRLGSRWRALIAETCLCIWGYSPCPVDRDSLRELGPIGEVHSLTLDLKSVAPKTPLESVHLWLYFFLMRQGPF